MLEYHPEAGQESGTTKHEGWASTFSLYLRQDTAT